MELYTIPTTDKEDDQKVIIYRPLSNLAFVGNQAMADLTLRLAEEKDMTKNQMSPEVNEFLHAVGFYEPDPSISDYNPNPQSTYAVLLMTNQCQLRCTYCYAAAGDTPRQELSTEFAYAVIDYVCQNAETLGRQNFEVSFHGGGEPTLAWRVLKACTHYARQKPLPAKITLTSNGVWSRRQCEWVIANLDGLSLSLDGSAETQDRQRPFNSGLGSFPWVMRTISELDRHQFPYGIRMTATAPWINLPKDVQFICEETRCQAMQVEPAFNTMRGSIKRPSEEDAQAFAEAFMEAFEIATQNGRSLYYSGARIGKTTSAFCMAPYNALIVRGDGRLVSCYEVTNPNHPLADISTFGHIDNNTIQLDRKARKRLHTLIAERRDSCKNCFCYWTCAGDCYMRAFENGPGGHLHHNHRCKMNRYLTKKLLLHRIAEAGGVWHHPMNQITFTNPDEVTTIAG